MPRWHFSIYLGGGLYMISMLFLYSSYIHPIFILYKSYIKPLKWVVFIGLGVA